MKTKTVVWFVIGQASLAVIALVVFLAFVLPRLDSPSVSGIVGVIVGAFTGLMGTVLSVFLGIWKTSKDADERIKDRVSNHALELTKMDYELRQKSLELSGTQQQFLAPAKVYRTFYRTLLNLHTTGEWSKEAENQGLLNIFDLGSKKEDGAQEPANQRINSDSQ